MENNEQVPIFQAIGVVRGEISMDGDSFKIQIGSSRFDLKAKGANKRLLACRLGHNLQVRVYPRFIHIPKQQPILYFQAVGVELGNNTQPSQLSDNEFILRGRFQYIAGCRIPVVSISRNFSKELKQHLDGLQQEVKAKAIKVNHCPLIWDDPIVPPFRYNPKTKEQGTKFFVQIKARFDPQTRLFQFDSLLAIPSEDGPVPFRSPKLGKKPRDKSKTAALPRNSQGETLTRSQRTERKPKPSKSKPTSQPGK